ncbi:hypothetical protein [Alterisphingorhabdus coralli]|uniref:Uncharacterized protein n=1 Tax=Alterisphingorhabdus coralli TaxID=3071408 RepID=A0AA97F7Z8_9SPHN|nr:hypothetical protein [Parasphingorhabdus sp. SCSIO 66989]WOE76094.1 hypothetical protein RB602_05085 [Parasphingorhabdus sp. SCSIO 66989]
MAGLDVSGAIGNATINTDALLRLDQQRVIDTGFYAIAYEWNGETVISYRGTNFPSSISPAELQSGWDDIWGGWSLFTGIGSNSHAALARDFYTSVTGSQPSMPVIH